MHDEQLVESAIDKCMGQLTTEDYNITSVMYTGNDSGKMGRYEGMADGDVLLDFCCFDVAGGIDSLYEIRKKNKNMNLLLLVDEDVSPVEYLRPGIKPDAVLIRPFVEKSVMDTMRSFLSEGIAQRMNKDGLGFMVDAREGKCMIPYDKIYYFESREKKIFVKTLGKEYGFYGTMEELQAGLPDSFIRCHRSYIVNKSHIERFVGVSSNIILNNGFEIPVSRSYREQMRGGK